MTDDDRDRELTRLFEAERRADESAAPDLDGLLTRVRPRGVRPGARRRIALALAVAGVLAAAVLLVRGGASYRGAPPADSAQLAEWKSPTAFLLQTPGSELLTQVPTLASPPTDDPVAPQPTKGVAQ